MYALPENPIILLEQPVEKIDEASGLYFRSVLLEDANTIIPTHAHDHDHATVVGSGRARGWKGTYWIGDKGPGEAFEIKAREEHTFMSLEPMTRLICTHDIASAESVKRKES